MVDHKSKRPANTAFKQQRLKAWQPILTPKTVLPAFFILGIVFVPIGIGLYIASNNVQQIIFDYTNCKTDSPNNVVAPIKAWNYSASNRTCAITFTVPQDMNGPVFMYYRLTNFYQNHRRYVKSFDANQLANIGSSPTATSPPAPTSVCSPLSRPSDAPDGTYPWVPSNKFDANAIIYPCGLIANSYFSDKISNLTSVTGSTLYTFSANSIAWPSDTNKFKKNDMFNVPNVTNLIFPPPQWATLAGGDFANGYNNSHFFDPSTDPRFQVWMRPAGLPNFRKLWGKLEKDTLPAGDYSITIQDTIPRSTVLVRDTLTHLTNASNPSKKQHKRNLPITTDFQVNTFGGTKSIVISTVSVLGGKNPFLGVAYIVVGIVCWILGLVFLLRHMIKPRKLGDYTYLSWNQPQRGATGGADTGVMGGVGPSGQR
ncbi:ligand-effect modulator 3 family [Chytriomyces sp. MP71]|nr:ligand-effect modulator 3 family [Chytriomyces sp. MP71]